MFIRQKLYAVLFATLYKNFFYIEQITAANKKYYTFPLFASFVTCKKDGYMVVPHFVHV